MPIMQYMTHSLTFASSLPSDITPWFSKSVSQILLYTETMKFAGLLAQSKQYDQCKTYCAAAAGAPASIPWTFGKQVSEVQSAPQSASSSSGKHLTQISSSLPSELFKANELCQIFLPCPSNGTYQNHVLCLCGQTRCRGTLHMHVNAIILAAKKWTVVCWTHIEIRDSLV